jgi:hypothetical protein
VDVQQCTLDEVNGKNEKRADLQPYTFRDANPRSQCSIDDPYEPYTMTGETTVSDID